MLVHELQQTQLDLRLVEKRLFVLDDLDGDPLLLVVVVGLHHLQAGVTNSPVTNAAAFLPQPGDFWMNDNQKSASRELGR